MLLAGLSGCATQKNLQFLGQTHQLHDLPAPDGFYISPQDAEDIVRERGTIKISLDNFYHDARNYYVVDALLEEVRKGRDTGAHTIINGQTGQVHNHETESWNPDSGNSEGTRLGIRDNRQTD